MGISGLRKIILTVLLALAAVKMLPACSSTEEVPAPEETGSGSGPCECLDGDIQCQEDCLLNLPI